MTEAFTKLFNSIITSSVWSEDDKTRLMWITMLASADANGFVTGAIPGMAAMARMSLKDAEKSIKALMKPDPYSRSKEYEGRRLLECEGGWLIANYTKYRQKRDPEIRREQNRDAKRRQRAKQKANQCQQDVSQNQPMSAQAEAEAEKEEYKEENADNTKVSNNSTEQLISPIEFTAFWNTHKTLLCIHTFTEQRKRALATRSQESDFRDNWKRIIEKLSCSAFHTGRNDRGWQASVDWLLKNSTNYVKVLELPESVQAVPFDKESAAQREKMLAEKS